MENTRSIQFGQFVLPDMRQIEPTLGASCPTVELAHLWGVRRGCVCVLQSVARTLHARTSRFQSGYTAEGKAEFVGWYALNDDQDVIVDIAQWVWNGKSWRPQ